MCSHSVQLLMIWAWNFRKPIKKKHNSQYFLSQRNVLFPDYVELRGHHYVNKCVQNARSRSGTYWIRHALSNFSERHISLYQINTYLLQNVYVWSAWRLRLLSKSNKHLLCTPTFLITKKIIKENISLQYISVVWYSVKTSTDHYYCILMDILLLYL